METSPPNKKESYYIRPLLTSSDQEIDDVIALINEAFMEDAFFKLPHKRQRLKLRKNGKSEEGAAGVERIEEALQLSTFLVAESTENGELLGCIRVERDQKPDVASFGMLSVPERNQNRGIGRALVQAAERFAVSQLNSSRIEISVVNIRTPVVQFYEKLGYETFGEPICFDELLGKEILLPEYKGIVKFNWMGKDLSGYWPAMKKMAD